MNWHGVHNHHDAIIMMVVLSLSLMWSTRNFKSRLRSRRLWPCDFFLESIFIESNPYRHTTRFIRSCRADLCCDASM